MHAFIHFLLWIIATSQSQQIFDYSCDYNLNNETITFYSNNIIRVANKKLTVVLNLCGKLDHQVGGCNSNASACVIDRTTNSTVTNIFNTFVNDVDDNDNSVLKSSGPCSGKHQPYELIVRIADSNNDKGNIIFSTACSVIVEIPNPDRISTTPCTARVDNRYLLNFSDLARLGGAIIPANDGKKVAVSFCTPSELCQHSQNASVCEILDDGVSIVPLVNIVHHRYVYSKNQVVLRGFYGQYRRNSLSAEVIIRCNWTTELGNAIQRPGKYKYQVDSRHGCVKLPINCDAITDMDKFVYNLSGLNRTTGWKVRNASSIYLVNVCGVLELAKSNAACRRTYSQSCYDGINYGTTSLPIRVDDDRPLLEMINGEACKHNPSLLLSTRVEFVCAWREEGPRLVDVRDCRSHIVWETPHACPLHRFGEMGYAAVYNKSLLHRDYPACSLVGPNGQFYDLSALRRDDDNYAFKDADGNEIMINICRPLVVKPDNYLCNLNGACLRNVRESNIKKRFISLGDAHSPIYEDGKLVIRGDGHYCSTNAALRYEYILHFHCSKDSQPLRLVRKSGCTYEFAWNTREACVKKNLRTRSPMCSNEFGNISGAFSIIYGGAHYNFTLCHNHFDVTKNDIKYTKQAPFHIHEANCKHYISYNLTTLTTCTTSTLNRLNIELKCDDFENNAHIETYTMDEAECVMNVVWKTNVACTLPRNKTCVDDNNSAAAAATVQDVQPLHKNSRIKQCIIFYDNEKSFNLQNVTAYNIASAQNNIYTLGGTQCSDGFLCRNGLSIIAKINEFCPSMSYDALTHELHVLLLGEKCDYSSGSYYNANVTFRCADGASVVRETKCGVALIVPDERFCVLNHHHVVVDDDHSQIYNNGANTALIIGIVILLIVIISIISMLIYCKKRHGYQYNSFRGCQYFKDGDL